MGQKNKDVHPCEGCQHYGIRDYGYGPHERHDNYCFKHCVWNPNGCNEKEEE